MYNVVINNFKKLYLIYNYYKIFTVFSMLYNTSLQIFLNTYIPVNYLHLFSWAIAYFVCAFKGFILFVVVGLAQAACSILVLDQGLNLGPLHLE